MKRIDIENELSAKSKEMKIPSQYKNIDWGKKTKLVNRKVILKDTKTGEIYGSKAIMTKEHITFSSHLINESDVSLLPEVVINELKSNIRTGAKDLAQQWKNALELVNKAYHVANVRRPSPDIRGAWRQYEDLIQFGVRQLSATRGLGGDWRMTSPMIKESYIEEGKASTHRFFVEIPGESAREIDGNTLDDIVDSITNKIRSSKQVTQSKVRVSERTATHVVLSVFVDDILKEKIVIKQIS
jgi:hypothetical protein